ncbi:TonB-dependent receptor [Govanella unica]|uniref:TonB-dependent receptor n=1 Tax=Govanella unica TaxID=2975056 RepID=A0A9X3Z635_9PROT|nr:TonB-dependent receptor [Govania unica]MDA5192529.1 TonB-dependent receptor [Govania unica]
MTQTNQIKLRKQTIAAGVSMMALAMASAATAAEPNADVGYTLEEIVVTAQKREERLQDTPISITAFTGAALAEKSVFNLQAIAQFTPNVEINNGRADGGGSSFNAYIRGIGQQDFLFPTEPGVGLYVDGVYLARTSGGTLALSDIARIEVLRGPQGTLYGKNTVGGAINIYSLQPDANGPVTGAIEGTTGRFNRSDVKAHVMFPIIDGVLAAKISGAALHRNGFGERVQDGRDLGNENKQVGRFELRWTPSSAWDISLRGDFQRQKQNGPVGSIINRFASDVVLPDLEVDGNGQAIAGAFKPCNVSAGSFDPGLSTCGLVFNPGGLPNGMGLQGLTFDDIYNKFVVPNINSQLGLPAGSRYDGRWVTGDPTISNGTSPSLDNNRVWGLSLTAAWSPSDEITIKSISAYRELSSQSPRDGDHTPYPVVYTANDIHQSQFSQELQLGGSSMNDRLKWLVGGFYMREHAYDDNTVNMMSGIYSYYPLGLTFNYLPYNEIWIDTWAVFGQGTYELTDRLSLTVGGRYSKDKKKYYQDHLLSEVPGTGTGGLENYVGPRTLKDSWGSFTPKVALDFKATDDVLLYASYAKGFKGGGWSPRPTQQNDSDLSYDPEILNTFEVGTKTAWFDNRMTFNVAGFYSIYKDVQVTTVDSGSNGSLLLLTRNVGEARLYGLEAELVARPMQGLDLNMAVGYLHSEWHKLNIVDANLKLSNKLVDSPKWTLNMGAQYRLPISENFGSLVLRGDASFRSLTWKDPFNVTRAPASRPGDKITERRMAQDAYWLVNTRLSWTNPSDNWEVALFVTNLLDKRYFTSMLPVDNFGYDEAYVGRPREWGLSASYKF